MAFRIGDSHCALWYDHLPYEYTDRSAALGRLLRFSCLVPRNVVRGETQTLRLRAKVE
jgi:hypothetical protein